ncbi:hypothetical protein [Flavobacterium pedocola]
MKKIFFGILTILLVFHFGYKAELYFSCDKIKGKVVNFKGYSSRNVHTNRHGNEVITYYSYETPIIEANIEGETQMFTQSNWDNEYAALKVNDSVTVLIDKKKDIFELNLFFLFWLTVWDVFYGLLILIFGSILLGILLPEKKYKPINWK